MGIVEEEYSSCSGGVLLVISGCLVEFVWIDVDSSDEVFVVTAAIITTSIIVAIIVTNIANAT